MKLFVGNLSWNTDDETLRMAFAAHGEVEDARVITDRETGRSRGFGFVTFSNSDDANAAIEALDGAELDGRPIKVNQAREREFRGGNRGGGNRGGGNFRGHNNW